MKPLIAIAAVLALPACSYAQGAQASQPASGPKACEELKSEIAGKLDAKGVKSYTLEIVDKDKEVTEGKAVGTCEGGTKKIVYNRGSAKPEAPAKPPAKP
jgi:hypothetical protein